MKSTTDTLDSLLASLLVELYDYILRESQEGPFQVVPNLYKQIAAHDSYDALVSALTNDASLAKFFPSLRDNMHRKDDASFLKKMQTVIIWSDGTSEGMLPVMLCSSIIGDVFRFLWSWGEEPSLDRALERLPDSINLARNLAEGRKVKIPALVAIHNIELQDNKAIEIGGAVIRKPIRYDRSRLYTVLPDQDKSLTLRIEANFSVIHMRPRNQEADGDEEHQRTLSLIKSLGYPSMEKEMWYFQRAVDHARLAVVLASRPDRIFCPVQGMHSVVNPLSDVNHGQMSSARSLKAPYPSQVIDESALREISEYTSLIERYPDVLSTGIRRLLLAITERMYLEDAFVDAIICWENLFSGTPETTLRVCGAMSKLLASFRDEDTEEVYKVLADLYRKRNAIVHGSSTGASSVTAEDRERAVYFTLESFRAIYRREDLLNITTSPKRGLKILLEG